MMRVLAGRQSLALKIITMRLLCSRASDRLVHGEIGAADSLGMHEE